MSERNESGQVISMEISGTSYYQIRIKIHLYTDMEAEQVLGNKYEEPKCGICKNRKSGIYPNKLVCYETEEHPGMAVEVKERQKPCRSFGRRRDH
ncbi:hypothetical protein Ga0466249_002231 [Sporomusaceae bacterium BoRhaA]|uniref:hypothetical protein n=1 Tax=Pelorhabdus rhamnosifermentans TaxID=2772457 RepID=UPI001C05EEB7|nr:hypothetical protein [Pelorhabdus rhamnosifermentans]MBU2701120.1 hypothetical protein [Pelorhabdus rhamnosifermentans]